MVLGNGLAQNLLEIAWDLYKQRKKGFYMNKVFG
jgi:hypothetical protein